MRIAVILLHPLSSSRARLRPSDAVPVADPDPRCPRVGALSARHAWLRRALLATGVAWMAGCVSLTTELRAVIDEPSGLRIATLQCANALAAADAASSNAITRSTAAVDPAAIRMLVWNIHKEEDRGWQVDLARLAQTNDILLLQEVTLQDSLQAVLRDAGLRWILASSFIYRENDVGVLTAARVAPVATCTQRAMEPIAQLPKSAVITWLPLAGTADTLAVANVHAINFTLTLDDYHAQLRALEDVLAQHRGPVVLAGDFNTWSGARMALLEAMASRLQLRTVTFSEDRRSHFLGRPVDHVFVRDLAVLASSVQPVTSSDHNPLEVVLRIAR